MIANHLEGMGTRETAEPGIWNNKLLEEQWTEQLLWVEEIVDVLG